MANHKNFIGVRCSTLKPTRAHRPALWECMLGTVYAMNAAGEARYFDYDYEAAQAFAGVDQPGADPRVARVPLRLSYVKTGATEANPRVGRMVLWVRR